MIYEGIDIWNASYYYLSHYGVKGMKWGIRKKNRNPRTKIIREAIKRGEVSTNINIGNQKKHLPGREPQYNTKGLINAGMKEVSKMINDMSLTGEAIMDDNGNWTKKERVKSTINKGIAFCNNMKVETGNFIISYGKKGVHIRPGQPSRREIDEAKRIYVQKSKN